MGKRRIVVTLLDGDQKEEQKKMKVEGEAALFGRSAGYGITAMLLRKKEPEIAEFYDGLAESHLKLSKEAEPQSKKKKKTR